MLSINGHDTEKSCECSHPCTELFKVPFLFSVFSSRMVTAADCRPPKAAGAKGISATPGCAYPRTRHEGQVPSRVFMASRLIQSQRTANLPEIPLPPYIAGVARDVQRIAANVALDPADGLRDAGFPDQPPAASRICGFQARKARPGKDWQIGMLLGGRLRANCRGSCLAHGKLAGR